MAIHHAFPLACDGCFVGLPAIISFVVAAAVLIGSIYMLLASNLGARQGYLVLMVSLFGFMMIISAIWLFGVPGTTPGTGPRGREPAWIPFTPTSEVAQKDFAQDLASFPSGWDKVGKTYPGKIESKGEIENVRTAIKDAEARLADKNGLAAKKSDDWGFRPSDLPPATPEEAKLAAATVAFRQHDNTLLFGAIIPANAKHPQTTVFAYRDKGLVFLYALYFLLISILLFAVHLVLLARFEKHQVEEQAKLEPALT